MRRTVSRTFGIVAVTAMAVVLVTGAILASRPVLKQVCSTLIGSLACASETYRCGSEDDVSATSSQVSRLQSDAAEETKKGEAPKDEGKPRKTESVNIRIDESGIRIEGTDVKEENPDTSAERIIIGRRAGDMRAYKEKGADIVRFGEDVEVKADELVRGDVVVCGGDVTVEGRVVGDVVVMCGRAHIVSGAEINGNAVVLLGTLEEDPDVIIHGERVIWKNINVSTSRFPFILRHHANPFRSFFKTAILFFISIMLSFLVVLFLRGRVARSQEHVVLGPLKSFGTGFLVAFIGVFIIPIMTLILLITIIGIPLAVLLVASCIAVYFVADTVFVYALGTKVAQRLNIQTTNPFAIVVVGMAVLYLPAFIGVFFSILPFGGFVAGLAKVFGFLLGVFAFLAGLGALFISRFGGRAARAPIPPAGPIGPQQVSS